MFKRQGFTLIEVLVVMFILGILTALVFPSMVMSQRNGAIVNAQNNLVAVYHGQQSYFFKNNSAYCNAIVGPPPQRCDTLARINSNLNLNITDTAGFTYGCAGDVTGFVCTATKTFNAYAITWTLKNTPIVLNGGVGTVNPVCASVPASNFCPPQL